MADATKIGVADATKMGVANARVANARVAYVLPPLKLIRTIKSIFQFGDVLLPILSNQGGGRRDRGGGDRGGGFAQQDL